MSPCTDKVQKCVLLNPHANAISTLKATSSPLVVVFNKSNPPIFMAKVGEDVVMEWLLNSGLKPSQFVWATA
ncbi:unnamed protein product [Taenia asiatica]|uniref:Thioredoxin-like_fold domain-containing protein n=1 Tax=Taenia asiatica TaxID=60517 RepID=A0A0R3VVL0_TAEAS|nr:unnamed protein product [Taenia asiatica]